MCMAMGVQMRPLHTSTFRTQYPSPGMNPVWNNY